MIRFLLVFIIIFVLVIRFLPKRRPSMSEVPKKWQQVGHHPEMQRAIDLRQRIVQLILKSEGESGSELIQSIDNLISPLAKTLALKEILSDIAAPAGGEVAKNYQETAKNIDENAKMVIAHLEKTLASIVALAGAELALHLEPLQEEFEEQQKILHAKLKTTRELSQYLDKPK